MNVDEIVQTWDLDITKFKGKMQTVKSQLADAMNFGGAGGSIGGLAGGAAVASIGAITAALATMGSVGKSAFEQFATYDSQVKALESVEGSAKAAAKAMDDLRQIAKAPGIGFAESISSYVQLRNAGVSGSKAENLIREIANANARGGGGIDTFQRAMMAISQIAMKPQLQGEELLQLMEAGIPVQGMIKKRFGTSDTDQLRKQGVTSAQVLDALVAEMSKLDRVSGGAQNSIDNMQSAVSQAMVSIGSSVATVAVPWLDALSQSLEDTTNAGVLRDATESIMQSFGLLGSELKTTNEMALEFTKTIKGMSESVVQTIDLGKALIEGIQNVNNYTPSGAIINGLKKFAGSLLEDIMYDPNIVDPQASAANEARMQKEKAAILAKRKPKTKESAQVQAMNAMAGISEPPKPVIPLLERIATNTEPLKQFADQLLGGGALARNALNKQDLSDLRSGRRSGDKIEDAVRGLVDAVRAEVIGSQLGNPFRQF